MHAKILAEPAYIEFIAHLITDSLFEQVITDLKIHGSMSGSTIVWISIHFSRCVSVHDDFTMVPTLMGSIGWQSRKWRQLSLNSFSKSSYVMD
jgi:hypothetical protein